MALFVFLLMLGMGSTLRTLDFKAALKRPKGIIIGFVSQFGLMPLIAFGLAALFKLPPEAAIGLILVGCTPGGTTSNLFTYFSKGDVALSISMTVASTVTAFFMMPLLLFVYTTQYTSADLVIPYANIIVTLMLVLIPVTIGVLIRSKNEKIAKVTEKIGSYVGILVILMTIVAFFAEAENRQLLSTTGYEIFMSAILLGVVGYFIGYWFSSVARLDYKQRKTVALETGIQNTPLTIGVIVLSFSNPGPILWLPMLYALFVVFTSLGATVVFTWMNKIKLSKTASETKTY